MWGRCGEVIKGDLNLVIFEPPSFSVHNVRVHRTQVVADDSSVYLSIGLFVSEVLVMRHRLLNLN